MVTADLWGGTMDKQGYVRESDGLTYDRTASETVGLMPCSSCRSGMDGFVRDQFEEILRVDLETV
jgi:hypothetical protein